MWWDLLPCFPKASPERQLWRYPTGARLGRVQGRYALWVRVQRLAFGGGAWGRAGFLLAGTGGDFNVPSRTSALVCLTNTQEVIHAETVQIGMAKKYP